MKVTDALLDKLAKLSQLDIPPEKRSQLKKDLQEIMLWMEKLQEVNPSSPEELEQSSSAMRSDEPGETLSREEATQNSKHADGKFIRVPPAISSREDSNETDDQ